MSSTSNNNKENGANGTIRLPLLALRGVVVLPHMVMHLDVGRERSKNALESAIEGESMVVLTAQKESGVDEPGEEDLHEKGIVARVKQVVKLSEGNLRVLIEGLQRCEINRINYFDPYLESEVAILEEHKNGDRHTEALMRSLLDLFEQLVKNNKNISPDALQTVKEIEDPGKLTDVIASHLNLKKEDRQQLLEVVDPRQRMEKVSEMLHYEMEIMELERTIQNRVRKQMEQNQKEYYLREQMKAIQEELGEKEDKKEEVEEYREKINKAGLPEEVQEKLLKEVRRLEKMPAAAAETVVIRNYLDWVLDLPWSTFTEDRLDLGEVQRILDEDHYGLEKVKTRIVEHLAVRRLTRKIKGPILCLVGPPGVGKTSLGRSIARATGRNFTRITLGGVRDEAEIRGHRRTYVGALPGRIVQGMHQAGSKNPVFLLDEVDKLASDFRGDPAAALLEVLDPEQNYSFSDHFIESSFDLSRVMFITTANTTHNIPRTLLDRMETIHISGYTEEEKLEIARRHLIPKQLEENGLTGENLQISEGSLRETIRQYTREAGVRNLERNLSTVCRKQARRVNDEPGYSLKLTQKNLKKYLGVPRYRYGTVESQDRVGVASGLGWMETGGELIPVEVSLMKGSGKLTLTGKMGNVMQESAQAALSYIRSRCEELGLEPDFFQNLDIHVHVPEGSIPKDGPSAGTAMAVAMVSSLTGAPVSCRAALTGEITLRGRVLHVGGIKEKVLAAHRAGIKKVIIPAENRHDKEEIPSNVLRQLEVVEVEHMDEVLREVLVNFQLPGMESPEKHLPTDVVADDGDYDNAVINH